MVERRGWKDIVKRKRPPVFLLLAVGCCLWPTESFGQFLSQGERIGSQLSQSSRLKQRTTKQRRGEGPDLEEYIRRLSNDRPETRLAAVRSLGDSKNPKAIDYLMNATADIDLRVRVKAIEYLGNMRASAATPALARQLFLRDVHPGVKKKVLIALGKIGDPRGAVPIMQFLQRKLDEPTRGVALFALRDVGNEHVLAFLDDYLRKEKSVPLRRLATDAAMDIRDRLSPEFEPVKPSFVEQVELREKMEQGRQ